MLSQNPISKKPVLKLGGSCAMTLPKVLGLEYGDEVEIYLDSDDMSFLVRRVVSDE